MNPVSAILSLVLLLGTCGPGKGEILRVADGLRFSPGRLVEELTGARLVFVGELHDQDGHHDAQLEVIRRLHEAGKPLAVGLEMFTREDQGELDSWVAEGTEPKEFVPVYYRNWDFPWALYQEIFIYAREHSIPLLGLNVPSEITRQVARQGFDSLSPEQRERLPGVSCDVDETYQRFIRRVLGDQAHGRAEFVNFCQAQMVWDTTMGHRLVEFLDRNDGVTVVVIAGSGHAWKRGIPAQVARRSGHPFRVILPEIPESLERGTVTSGDADYLWLGITRSP